MGKKNNLRGIFRAGLFCILVPTPSVSVCIKEDREKESEKGVEPDIIVPVAIVVIVTATAVAIAPNDKHGNEKNHKVEKVSFDNSSKIVEIDQEEEVVTVSSGTETDGKAKAVEEGANSVGYDDDDGFDPDTMDIDLTTGKKRRGLKKAPAEKFAVEALSTSLALIPFHLPLLLVTMLGEGQLMAATQEALQKGFTNLSVMGLIYCVMVGEKAKCERNPTLKSNGPKAMEFLYTALSYPFSILLSVPIYVSFLLFGAPAGPSHR